MALETQTQKNKAAVIQYTSALESLKAKYSDVNAAKAITKVEHTEGLENQYKVVTAAITELSITEKSPLVGFFIPTGISIPLAVSLCCWFSTERAPTAT